MAADLSDRAENSLARLFHAKRIAVVGSAKRGKIAHQIMTQLTEGDYSGTVWAVNPKGERPEGIAGVHAASSIEEIDGSPDAAIICAPAAQVQQVIEDCGRSGVPVGVVLTSGFSETGKRDEEEKLKKSAAVYGMRLVGPNCAGIMNPHEKIFASIEVRALPGSVAFITQSGAVGGAVLAMAEERGIGFSLFASYGNRVDIGELELLEYLENDAATKAVALYTESLRDGRRFLHLASRIVSKKPLILIKAGRTSSGSRAAGSHTGSFAGSEEVFETMVKQTGIIRARGIEEMLDLVEGTSKMPVLQGRRVAVITNSGGPGILCTDRGEELGLELAEPNDATKESLRRFLPPHASVSNPVDLTVEGSDEDFRLSIETMLENEYDAAVVINVATPFLDSSGLAGAIADAAHKTKKPVAAVFMAGRIVDSGLHVLKQEGIARFPTGERAMEAIFQLSAYHAFVKQRKAMSEGVGPHEEDLARKNAEALESPVLLPHAADLLSSRGFTLPKYRFVDSIDALGEAVERLEFPLAMKVVSAEIAHKSDVGGVVLNLSSEEQTAAAFSRMEASLKSQGFRGVFLHEMIPQGLEMILGIKRDPVFGPVLLAGAGGIYTELIRDVSMRIAPIGEEEARAMIEELKVYRLMKGYRGKEALATDELVRALLLLSNLAMEHGEIEELDLNPIFLLPEAAVLADIHIVADPRQDRGEGKG
jgi:acetate---CoA ligase (ADP-forming)